MNIEFNNEEFKALLEMLYMSDWVMNAHKVDNPEDQVYSRLFQKVLSKAKESGLDSLVTYSEKDKIYFTSQEMDNGPAMKFIEDYDNDTFWDELVDRLGTRDFENEYGPDAFSKYELEEILDLKEPMEKKYAEEFSSNGLQNLVIK